MENDAKKFGAEIEAIEAEEIVDEGAHKIIRITDGSEYRCKTLILTMGSPANSASREKQNFWGRASPTARPATQCFLRIKTWP